MLFYELSIIHRDPDRDQNQDSKPYEEMVSVIENSERYWRSAEEVAESDRKVECDASGPMGLNCFLTLHAAQKVNLKLHAVPHKSVLRYWERYMCYSLVFLLACNLFNRALIGASDA